jgi:hypothetical protein
MSESRIYTHELNLSHIKDHSRGRRAWVRYMSSRNEKLKSGSDLRHYEAHDKWRIVEYY